MAFKNSTCIINTNNYSPQTRNEKGETCIKNLNALNILRCCMFNPTETTFMRKMCPQIS